MGGKSPAPAAVSKPPEPVVDPKANSQAPAPNAGQIEAAQQEEKKKSSNLGSTGKPIRDPSAQAQPGTIASSAVLTG